MPNYKLSVSSKADIHHIVQYTKNKWGESQAVVYFTGIEEMAQTLAGDPALEKKIENLAEGLRCFPYQSHVLYFVEAPDGITVARVLHENMKPSLHIKTD